MVGFVRFLLISCLFASLTLCGEAAISSGDPAPELVHHDSSHSWTLDELLAIGFEHNLGLQDLRLQLNNLPSDRRAAFGKLLPSLQFSSSLSQSERHTFSFVGPDGQVYQLDSDFVSKSSSSQFSLSAQQSLFEGFSRVSGLRSASLQEEVLLSENRRVQQIFRWDLQKTSHRVLAAQAQLKAEHALLETNRDQHQLAQTRLEVGAVTELDVMQTELDLGRQQVNLEAAEIELVSAWDALVLLLGVAQCPTGELALPFDCFEPMWNEEDLFALAIQQREDFRQSELQSAISKEGVIQARSAFLPRVSVGLSHSRDAWNSGLGDFEPYPDDYTNSSWVSLQVPLFQGFQASSNVQTSKMNVRRAELDHRRLRADIQSALREAMRYLDSAWRSSQITEKNRELSRQSLEIERERYRLGLSSLLSVQTMNSAWRRAESDHIRQTLAFRDRLADLEFQVGGATLSQ
jgi:outer membrane protein